MNEDNEEDCTCDNKLIELHGCPYQEEINGLYDYECICCESCTQECSDDI